MQAKIHSYSRIALITCGLFLPAFAYFAACSATADNIVQDPQATASPCATQGEADLLPLTADTIFERTLALHQRHCYKLALTAGQYARVIVEQQDIDVEVSVFAPDQSAVNTVDRPNGYRGPESISVLAKTSGIFHVVVKAVNGVDARARYRLRIAELRDANRRDEGRLSAERLVTEGESLRASKKADGYRKSLEKFDASLNLWRLLEDNYEQAVALFGMGLSYRALGENQRAEQSFAQSLALMREVKDRYGEALAQMGQAYAFLYLGETAKALDLFQQCLKLRRELQDYYGEGMAMYGVAWAYSLLDEHEKALDYFLQSLPLRRQYQDRKGEALTLLGIGRIYTWQGKTLEALEYLNRALQLIQAVKSETEEADVLSGLGWVQMRLNNYQAACATFQKALPLRVQVGDRAGEATTLFGIAKCQRQMGQLAAAKQHIEDALELLEALRSAGESCQLRISYFAEVQEYYDFYIDLLMQLHKANPTRGYAAAALQASEFARARSLIDLLNEAKVDIRQSAPGALINQENELQQKLNEAIYKQRRLGNPQTYTEAVETLKKAITELTDQHDAVLAKLRESSPAYAALKQPRILTAEEIQAQLDDDSLLLEYAFGKEQCYLWAVRNDSLKSYELGDSKEITKLARRLYELLTMRRDKLREAASDAEYYKVIGQLSRLLLGPVEQFYSAKRLVIAAPGVLQRLPFDLLQAPESTLAEGQTQYRQTLKSVAMAKSHAGFDKGYLPVIVTHEVVNIPSVSAIALQRSLIANRPPAPKTIAIFADPVFSRNDERINDNGNAKANSNANDNDGAAALERLSATQWEGKEIIKLVAKGQGLLALDFAANRALAISDEMKNYRILHFATHSFINDEHPELSEIALSAFSEDGQPQDGSLMAHELFKIKLPADLIVLSACKSGLGKEVRGEGLMNLSRMFMSAGAPRVIVSMWSLEDQAAADFMVSFYKKLLGKERLSPASALRATKIEMWKKERWSAPYYWGAFVLQGDWQWRELRLSAQLP
ncbi:MAG: CHAT domain-containing protein [Acidobacteria bacterium]|nr:CHAT domain-containing protein [Acidobacteriota bacterium]